MLVDTEGTELPLEPAFDSQTDRTFEVFESPEELEPGSYALRLLHTPYCDDPREVMLPLEVVDEVASPVTVTPVIEAVDAVMYGRESLVIDVEVEGPHEHWLLIEGDYAEFSGSSGADELVAPRHAEVGELSRYFDGPEQVEQVCVRASYLDLAGNRGPTSELCTTDIERRPFSDAGTCSVSRSPSPTWALFVLLGLAAARRRRQG
ncbi:MAG: MYXO-CTERM sorting domain-containing protein [Myxococcota bacterium]